MLAQLFVLALMARCVVISRSMANYTNVGHVSMEALVHISAHRCCWLTHLALTFSSFWMVAYN